MNGILTWIVCLIVALGLPGIAHGLDGAGSADDGLDAAKREMARVFAQAWTTEGMSVGVYDRPGWDDEEWRFGGKNFDRRAEMLEHNYSMMLCRENLKGAPPEALFYGWFNVSAGHRGAFRPFIPVHDSRWVFVLRPLGNEEEPAEDVIIRSFEDGREVSWTLVEGFSGTGCLAWNQETSKQDWERPDYLAPLSEEELADLRRCGEWASGKRGAEERPSPVTPWGREVLKWLE